MVVVVVVDSLCDAAGLLQFRGYPLDREKNVSATAAE